jgi:hypothetical protein
MAHFPRGFRYLVPLLLAGLLLSACQQTPIPETGEETGIRFEIGSDSVAVPEQAPTGIVTVTSSNTSQTPRSLFLARLNPEVTAEAFTESFQQGPEAALPLVSLVGGIDAPPGETKVFTVELEEGLHVAIGFPQGDELPLLNFFQVAGGEGAGSPPQADHTIELIDFDFNIPEAISAGQQTWEVTSPGQQPHELYLIRPEPGFTEERLLEMMQAGEEPQGPPPWEEVAFFGPFSQGERAWYDIDLEPGTYMALCFLPDISGSGRPHVELGMIETFEVGGGGE